MIILNVKTKGCMQHLLLKPTFDFFSLIEGEITTYNTFHVDGFLHKDFFDEPPGQEYSAWGNLRTFFFNLIRGKRTPLSFRFILSLPEERFEEFLAGQGLSLSAADIRGLYLNFKYDGTSLKCVTGTSLNIFTMDKSLENLWDSYAKEFFLKQEIDFETD